MATHNIVELSKEELDNYGIIISYSNPITHDKDAHQLKIDDIVLNGVKYIHRNLIIPF